MNQGDAFAPGDALRSVDILYVDGESHRRDSMRRLLLSLGARSVQLTEPGSEALKVALTTICGLVIAEHRTTPDGIAFVRQLRAVANYPRALLPALIVGDPVGTDIVKAALAAGANHFLVKPLSPAKLYERVAWAMADNRPFAIQDGHYVIKPLPARPPAPAMAR
jgi:response regulator RpfG family c-di-GMP phosphodiesterase